MADNQGNGFQVGQEVSLLCLDPSLTGSVIGKITQSETKSLDVEVSVSQELLNAGRVFQIEAKSKDLLGWASLSSWQEEAGKFILHLVNVRIETPDTARAERIPCSYSLNTAHIADDNKSAPKRSVGQTINLSNSGARIRTRTPFPIGIMMYLAFHVEGDQIIETLSEVVRVVEGTEARNGGFEVGVFFRRIISGAEVLEEVVCREAA